MKTIPTLAVILLCGVSAAGAQAPVEAGAVDPAYVRAQGLVSEGQGVRGRALVDSMYEVSAPRSAQRAEALFWRASLAAAAADAERDYRALIVDYPTSPRVEDALLRLAQLELTRGDRDAALRHLERLAVEYPGSRHSPRTSYWTARVLFDKNELPAACAANARALAQVPPGDVELRNQIEYQHQRCPRVLAVAGPDSTPAPTPVQAAVVTPPPRDVTPSIPVPAGRITTSPAPAPPPVVAQTFSVQVAATSTRSGALTIANRMKTRGYDARVDGTSAPFRVRIGRFATRASATRALNDMKAKGIDGFVAVIENR